VTELLSTKLHDWLSLSTEWAALIAAVLAAIIKGTIIIVFMLVSAIFFVWLERKVSARIQDRLGPTRVGGKFGWLQTLADGMKLLVKEDVIPADADPFLFRIAAYVTLAGPLLSFIALPFADGVVVIDMNVGVFFMLAVMSTEIFGIIMAGYGSGSKWSLFGGMREAAQMVSYEVPMAICVLVPVIVAGTMNLSNVGRQQTGFFPEWLVFHDPFTFAAFWVYFTCATASCKRAPFDLAEAESELVAGFHTEYSGFRWLIFFMAEYASMFAVSGIATLLFLGGWHTGLLPFDPAVKLGAAMGTAGWVLGSAISVTVFIVKCWLLVFVMMWVRWTLPRLRIDQVMETCLKYLLPISCALLLLVSLWQVGMPGPVLAYFRYAAALVCAALVVWMLYKVVTTRSQLPFAGVTPTWKPTAPAVTAQGPTR
jgi:NADH-quinone oxidoreductase subunit H